MEPLLRDLLRDASGTISGDKGNNYTHLTLYGPRNRWAIQQHGIKPFWTGYCNLVENHFQSNLCLAERNQNTTPLIVDLVLKFHKIDGDDLWEPYDEDFLHHLVRCYQEAIIEFLQVSDDLMEATCCVMESERPWEEDENGQIVNNRADVPRFLVSKIRLHFPYCKIDVNRQKKVIRPWVIQNLRNENVISKLTKQPVGDWEQIIDPNVVHGPITMYGSENKPHHSKLLLNFIWGHIDMDMVNGQEEVVSIPLEDIFVPQNHDHVRTGELDEETVMAEDNLEHWLPLFLSINYWERVVLPKEDRMKNLTKTMEIDDEDYVFGQGRKDANDETPIEIADRMLRMVSPNRYTDYGSWLEIGKALYTSDEGGETGTRMWVRYTYEAIEDMTDVPDFITHDVEELCEALYHTFPNNPFSEKTLAWFAREDSPQQYKIWHKQWYMSAMENAVSCSHYDVAKALYRVYWLDFTCSAITKGRWYQFKNHRWIEIDQGVALRKAISEQFSRLLSEIRAVLARQIADRHDDEGFKNSAELTNKKLNTLISKTKNGPYKNNIMRECMEHFYHDRFTNLLDHNVNTTGMLNGVLEAVREEIVFRPGKPEDFISRCTAIPYRGDFNWKHKLVVDTMAWLEQVFTDKDLLHHFLKFSASCLKGRNADKIFPIWTGGGDNSKSMIVKLFEAAFGPYCIKFPVSLLTGKRSDSGNANPQLARAKSTKVGFLQEPDDDEPMRKGIIKEFTGGDTFFARMLHDNGNDLEATFKMILICNDVPLITNADKAIKNRTKLFPFMSTWVDNPPQLKEEQFKQRLFKKDPHFEDKIKVLAPAFMWIIMQYYPYYCQEGLRDPDIIQESTTTYWRENDIYQQFTEENIKIARTPDGKQDANAKVRLVDIYTRFKEWYRQNFNGSKAPDRSVVKNELIKRWGRMASSGWCGIELVEIMANVPGAQQIGGVNEKFARAKEKKTMPKVEVKLANISRDATVASQMDEYPGKPISPAINMSAEDGGVPAV